MWVIDLFYFVQYTYIERRGYFVFVCCVVKTSGKSNNGKIDNCHPVQKGKNIYEIMQGKKKKLNYIDN